VEGGGLRGVEVEVYFPAFELGGSLGFFSSLGSLSALGSVVFLSVKGAAP